MNSTRFQLSLTINVLVIDSEWTPPLWFSSQTALNEESKKVAGSILRSEQNFLVLVVLVCIALFTAML